MQPYFNLFKFDKTQINLSNFVRFSELNLNFSILHYMLTGYYVNSLEIVHNWPYFALTEKFLFQYIGTTFRSTSKLWVD